MAVKSWLSAGIALGSLACSSETAELLGEDAHEVSEHYATIVQANYDDAVAAAQDLKAAVEDFVAAPSPARLQEAKVAWLAAREPYGQSEGFRFYDGPIDNVDTGPEGRINAWPLDEVFIDYVQEDASGGIINDAEAFPELTAELIAGQNEQGGEKNIATGYHAVEFLLWGQDLSADGPGDRPHTDYVTGATGTAENQDRRGQYLLLITEMLVDDLRSVADEWAAGENNYRRDFLALSSDDAIGRMLTGIGSLSGAELAGQRMSTAYDNHDQEYEHSCFSDNTHRDLHLNALSIQNVYLGRYGDHDGIGIDALVDQLDPDLNEQLKEQLEASLAAIADIAVPFDQALSDSAEREKILVAINALQDQTETLAEIAEVLGVEINLE